MIPTHGKEHERLLKQVTCGDIERDDAALLAALDECPECRDRLEGLDTVSDALERTAREQREILSSLDHDHTAPGSDLVGPFIRARLAARRRARWLRYAAAAAVIASAGAGWWAVMRITREPVAPHLLGSDAFQFDRLQGGVVQPGPVRWEFDLPPGGSYGVELLDAQGVSLAPEERLQQPLWTPSSQEEERLPGSFSLRVTAYDVYGQLVDWVVVPVVR